MGEFCTCNVHGLETRSFVLEKQQSIMASEATVVERLSIMASEATIVERLSIMASEATMWSD
jgi:hypothetical protein